MYSLYWKAVSYIFSQHFCRALSGTCALRLVFVARDVFQNLTSCCEWLKLMISDLSKNENGFSNDVTKHFFWIFVHPLPPPCITISTIQFIHIQSIISNIFWQSIISKKFPIAFFYRLIWFYLIFLLIAHCNLSLTF